MMNDVVERFKRNVRKPQLTAFVGQVRTGEYEIRKLGAGKIGNAVPNKNAKILVLRKAADHRRFAHAAIVIAILVASMRPSNGDSFPGKVASVAINMVGRDAERSKQWMNEKVDAAACHIKGNIMLAAPFEQLRKAFSNAGIGQNVRRYFFLHGGRHESEHFPNALFDRFLLGHDVHDDIFPALGVKVLHDGNDIVAQGNRTVKVAEQNRRTRECVVGLVQDVRTPQRSMAVRSSS